MFGAVVCLEAALTIHRRDALRAFAYIRDIEGVYVEAIAATPYDRSAETG